MTKFRKNGQARKADERRQVGCFFDALSFGQRGNNQMESVYKRLFGRNLYWVAVSNISYFQSYLGKISDFD